mgnify:CR=1 FL=1
MPLINVVGKVRKVRTSTDSYVGTKLTDENFNELAGILGFDEATADQMGGADLFKACLDFIIRSHYDGYNPPTMQQLKDAGKLPEPPAAKPS